MSVLSAGGAAAAAVPAGDRLPATVTADAGHGATPATLTSATRRHRHRVRTTVVRPGEGFWTIAERTHVDWHELAAVNGMTLETMLYAGQVLRLPAPGQTAPAPTTASAATAPASSGTVSGASDYAGPASSFESCVIQRESGGEAEVVNGSGHWGLYQFSQSLWDAYGGDPAAFGSAPAAEQQQVFDRVVAAGGASNWSAYDGC